MRAETTGSLTSDFRAKASIEDLRARRRVKEEANRRNLSNRAALGDWSREVQNKGNRVDIPLPPRLGGYKR